jgi:hypothetical protein
MSCSVGTNGQYLVTSRITYIFLFAEVGTTQNIQKLGKQSAASWNFWFLLPFVTFDLPLFDVQLYPTLGNSTFHYFLLSVLRRSLILPLLFFEVNFLPSVILLYVQLFNLWLFAVQVFTVWLFDIWLGDDQ